MFVWKAYISKAPTVDTHRASSKKKRQQRPCWTPAFQTCPRGGHGGVRPVGAVLFGNMFLVLILECHFGVVLSSVGDIKESGIWGHSKFGSDLEILCALGPVPFDK